MFVIDATVHSYNLDPSNVQPNRYAQLLADALLDVFLKRSSEEALLPQELYELDWSAEAETEVLFLESQTDIGGHHVLCLYSWFKDGLVSLEKNIELARRWPDRFVFYVGVDPTKGLACLDDLRRQKEMLPSALGLKMYHDQVEPYATFRADDRDVAYPLFELAQELGIKAVAMHKALPIVGLPSDPYKIDDMCHAALDFPDLNFELIHAGLAYLDETAHAIARSPNVYVNLEITSTYACSVPGLFDEIMSNLLFWGGPEKIIYSSGAMEFHPQPILEKMAVYQPSAEMERKFGSLELTDTDRQNIMGGNFARMMGLDMADMKARIASDEFAQRLDAQGGLASPFSFWRDRNGATVGAR
jgi:hypothetical protein